MVLKSGLGDPLANATEIMAAVGGSVIRGRATHRTEHFGNMGGPGTGGPSLGACLAVPPSRCLLDPAPFRVGGQHIF